MQLRARYALLGAITLVCGLTVRFAPLGLPPFIVKYGGSTLWALLVYWTLAFLSPKTRPLLLASVAGVIATIVELQRLYHAPALDAFRHSLAGILLLGNIFSMRDIAAYWLAIGVGAVLDSLTRPAARMSELP